MTTSRRDATAEEARALAHPLRLRILRLVRFESLTNAEIARRLGQRPATTLHHVRTLVNAGFIEQDGERPGPNGIVEKPYRDTGRSWSLNVTDGPDRTGDISSAALDAFVAEVGGDRSTLQSVSRLSLRLSAESLEELGRRLTAVLDDFEGRHNPDGRPHAVFVAVHRISDEPPRPAPPDAQTPLRS